MKKFIPIDAVLVPDVAEKVFEGVIFDVYQWQLTRFDGSMATWEMLKRPDTTEAICIINGKILVIEEQQPHSGSSVSFPGGRADMDDNVLDAIKRETKEEVGYEFDNWKLIEVRQPHPKIEWFVHVFVAWGIKNKGATSIDPGEKITPKLKTFEEVKKMTQADKNFIKEERNIFIKQNSIQDLVDMPEFHGTSVDR